MAGVRRPWLAAVDTSRLMFGGPKPLGARLFSPPAPSERRHRSLACHCDSVRTFLRNPEKSRFFIHLRY
jgi:hypothetical protein